MRELEEHLQSAKAGDRAWIRAHISSLKVELEDYRRALIQYDCSVSYAHDKNLARLILQKHSFRMTVSEKEK